MKEPKTIDDITEELKTSLKQFMEKNRNFNLKGRYKEEDDITVTVLVDFGIEDRDNGSYYVADVFCRLQDNLKVLQEEGLISPPEDKSKPSNPEEVEPEKLKEFLGESDTFMEVENRVTSAIRKVFDVGRYTRLRTAPTVSDVDISSTIPIHYGNWETVKGIEAPV